MPASPRAQMVLKQLTQLLNMGLALSEAVRQLRVMLDDDALVDAVLAERQAIIDSQMKLSLKSALFDPEDAPEPWYVGPIDTDKFWPKLKASLEADPDWAKAVQSLDETSTRNVALLADPHSPVIATRGLVLGYVQSGKTANFTATIAKAADAGYRMFVVLSGVHNSLRRQTQLRMDEQLCDLNPTQWVQLTDEFKDFGNPVKALPLVAGSQLKLLAVVKKNVSRLTKLREWLETAHASGGLDNCPVLVIDDEADQASPNSHKDPELDRTRINEELVAFLSLPRVAYVGYTATPFANILANPADAKDIYPRSFVQSLPKPPGYFGAQELFGGTVSEDESPDTVPHDMIRFVDDDEAELHRVKTKEQFTATITPSLSEAIRWFVMATAARRARSGKTQHSSMLVHTTMRVQPQLDYLEVVKGHLRDLASDLDRGIDKWRAQWDDETSRETAEQNGLAPVPFEAIEPLLAELLREVKVVADNSQSTDRLLYSEDPATVIAIGGNTLSRGLTLHGLVSSFFLRSGATYDSLLQMGRWFGYRPKYEDLPRIWTTAAHAADFQFLSKVELEMRDDIDRYASGEMTPLQLAVRIALHPRMQPTAKLKMHFAVRAAASFSEHRPQTTYLRYSDQFTSRSNIAATRDLLSRASGGLDVRASNDSYRVMRDVPAVEVQSFLAAYAFHGSSEMSGGLVEKYIASQLDHGHLNEWNIAVATRKAAPVQLDLGLDSEVNAITRSKLKIGSDATTANIGTLMSRKDRLVDLAGVAVEDSDAVIQEARNASGRALLLIYPIDKMSRPRLGASNRTSLDAVENQIGIAIVFPKAAPNSESADKIQVDLSSVDEDLNDEPAYEDTEGSQDEVELGE